jgi:hypothetical protein
MRPKGLGLLLRSRQLHPEVLALDGERCPFSAAPFGSVEMFFLDAALVEVFDSVKLLIFRTLRGLRLFDLALLKSGFESKSSSSILSSIFAGVPVRLFVEERVIGPKYPSLDPSWPSEGVGDGEITLGVDGIIYCDIV